LEHTQFTQEVIARRRLFLPEENKGRLKRVDRRRSSLSFQRLVGRGWKKEDNNCFKLLLLMYFCFSIKKKKKTWCQEFIEHGAKNLSQGDDDFFMQKKTKRRLKQVDRRRSTLSLVTHSGEQLVGRVWKKKTRKRTNFGT